MKDNQQNPTLNKTEIKNKTDFLKILSKNKKCYMQKPRSWQRIWFWYEILPYDKKEQWFMNISKGTKDKIPESIWMVPHTVNVWIDGLERKGYKYYINN